MKQVVKQLERVRLTAKWLLVIEAGSRRLAMLILVVVICAVADYLMRLPGQMRLVVDVLLLVLLIRWLVGDVMVLRRFKPQVGDLALRAERLFPQLAGVLASSIELSWDQRQMQSPRTAALANLTISRAQQGASDVSFMQLIDASKPVRRFCLMVVVLAMAIGGVYALPAQARVAAQRWFNPMGHAQWSRRTSIESQLVQELAPTDQPLQLSAAVHRGYRRGMRAWMHYRMVQDGRDNGPWQSVLMNEQSDHGQGMFETILDLPQLTSGTSTSQNILEVYFAAGDDRSPPQRVRLIERPALRSASMDVTPPDYAQGLISAQTIAFDQQSGQIATAVIHTGSKVNWQLELNKPIPTAHTSIETLLPGFPEDIDAQVNVTSPDTIDVSLVAKNSLQTTIVLRDEHGLESQSQRLYRITALEDKSPTATMTQPPTDEAVLATAAIDVAGVAEDDVAVESLKLAAQWPIHDASKETIQTSAMLDQTTGRHRRMAVNHELELARLNLNVGDQIILSAIAQDIFDLDGRRHDPVRSAPRILRVIDPAQLTAQIRNELAAVRQQAVRLATQQQRIMQTPADQAKGAQHRVTQRLEGSTALIKSLRKRMDRNRLEDDALGEVIDRATELVGDAQVSSDQAQTGLQNALKQPGNAKTHLKQAKNAQQKVGELLTELVALLDQGQDAMALQRQLRELARMQEELARQTKQLLPETAGLSKEKLSDTQRRKLNQLSQQQRSLSKRAESLTQKMQATAEALQQPDADEQQQASARSLSQAAKTSQSKGLSHLMQKAANAAKDNRLGESGRQQRESSQILEQMLAQMNQRDKHRREILKRKLEQLAQAIEQLVKRQEAQLTRLDKVKELTGLDLLLAALRRNTLSVEDQARQSRKTQTVADELGGAVKQQAGAISALRSNDREASSDTENQALKHLRAALELVRKMRNAAQNDQTRRAREQLRKAYQLLAERQLDLHEKTKPLTGKVKPNRRHRANVIRLGHEEEDLRIAAGELTEQGKQPMLFEHVHNKIDKTAGQVVEQLRSGAATTRGLSRQQHVAKMLEQLAAALEETTQPQDFENSSGSGGGGGKGGGELIPPAAQLKLFRGMQESIFDRTRLFHESADTDDAQREQHLINLSVEQRELALLGEKMNEKMKNRAKIKQPVEQAP